MKGVLFLAYYTGIRIKLGFKACKPIPSKPYNKSSHVLELPIILDSVTHDPAVTSPNSTLYKTTVVKLRAKNVKSRIFLRTKTKLGSGKLSQ